MYQPLPLNMMPGAEINLLKLPPQRSQVVSGASLIFCFTSDFAPHP